MRLSPVAKALSVVELDRHPEHVPAAPLPQAILENYRPLAVHNLREDTRQHVDQISSGVVLQKKNRNGRSRNGDLE